MFDRPRTLLALLALLALTVMPGAAPAADDAPRSARDVVERHAKDLHAALRLALRPALAQPGREVAFVVDVTPYTQAGSEALIEALLELEAGDTQVPRWHMAPLGGRFGEPSRTPTGLVRQFQDALAHETRSANTMLDLQRTLRGFDARDGVVVYLADWHIEDDHELERFVDGLARRGQTFSVVGSESAFTRGWNDGLFAGSAGAPDPNGGGGSYDPRIGRDVFGRRDPVKPWHGGATGYPHLPWHFHSLPWLTEFSGRDDYALHAESARADGVEDEAEREDLRERLQALREDEKSGAEGEYPLPAGWGPYGLMRAAAVTGGNYVLWSWNPSGRSNVTYDYARIDLFPPDLRSRTELRRDIRSRPLARALMEAWHLVARPRAAIAAITPPVEDDLRTPQPIVESRPGRCLACEWVDHADVRNHRRVVGDTLDGLDAAILTLDKALRATDEPTSDIDRRLAADADLFRHTLLTLRFSLGEIDAVNRLIGNDAWDLPDTYPLAAPTEFLLRGYEPEDVKPRTETVFDPDRAAELVADRKRMLARYRGTPWAATVARNTVNAYRLAFGKRRFTTGDGSGTRTPAESVEEGGVETPPAGPGRGSQSGGGAGTGR